MYSRSVHWFRRDLRVADNTALRLAVDQSKEVVPVCILSSWQSHHLWTGPVRQEFLCGCLDSLAKNIV